MSSMKLIMESWRNSLLTEKVYGAQAIVYHGSKTPPEDMIKIFTEDKFDPGQGAGSMYGNGLYTVYGEEQHTPTFIGGYGKWIYKLKINLYGFIIFDSDVCQKVYGEKLSPMQQLKKLGHDDIIEKLEEEYRKKSEFAKTAISTLKRGETPTKLKFIDKLKRLFGPLPQEIQPTTRQLGWLYQRAEGNVSGPPERELTSEDAQILSNILSKKVKGIVFTGGQDGRVAVVYDTSIVALVAWTEAKPYWQQEKPYSWTNPELNQQPIWNKIEPEAIKKSLARTASGDYTPGRFNK